MDGVASIGSYALIETIGGGGFSTVYKCRGPGGKFFAIKVGDEDVRSEFNEKGNDIDAMTYMEEWTAYSKFQYGKGVANQHGIPTVVETGLAELENEEMRPYLVMQLLGKSLSSVITKGPWNHDRLFDCAIAMIDSLEYIHSKGIIHRDIKPSNFCFDVQNQKKLYLLDLGFACTAPSKIDRSKTEFVGTPDYSSTPALRGYRQSYRDDMESLAYTLLEMWLKDLPWFLTNSPSIKERGWTKQNLTKLASKRDSLWKQLIKDGKIPTFLSCWVHRCKHMKMTELPDYDYFRRLIEGEKNKGEVNRKRKKSDDDDVGERSAKVRRSAKARLCESEE